MYNDNKYTDAKYAYTEQNREQELNASLFVLELEERLEMVQAAPTSDLAAGPVISCCFDSDAPAQA